MKKSLFLLPLLGLGLVLGGCQLPFFGGNNGGGSGNGSGTGTGTGTGTGGGGGGQTTGGGTTVEGTLLATIDMTNPATSGTKVSDDEYTWSSGGCTVRVKTNTNTNQNVATAVSSSGSYEMRLYNKFTATLECTQNFKAFVLTSTTYSDSKYVYDDPNFDNATVSFDGNITTTVTLNTPSTSFEIYAYKQIRVASIAFYA